MTGWNYCTDLPLPISGFIMKGCALRRVDVQVDGRRCAGREGNFSTVQVDAMNWNHELRGEQLFAGMRSLL